MHRYKPLLAGALVLALIILSGCAVDREYQVGLNFYPRSSLKETPTGQNVTVALAPLVDNRPEKKLILAEYNSLRGQDRYYWKDENVNLTVTKALKEGLQEAGIRVIDVPSWDRTSAGLSTVFEKTVLGGTLEDFTCVRDVGSAPFLPVLNARLKLTIYIGDAATRSVKQQTFEASLQSEELLFLTENDVEHTLSVVMSDVIEKVAWSPMLHEVADSGTFQKLPAVPAEF